MIDLTRVVTNPHRLALNLQPPPTPADDAATVIVQWRLVEGGVTVEEFWQHWTGAVLKAWEPGVAPACDVIVERPRPVFWRAWRGLASGTEVASTTVLVRPTGQCCHYPPTALELFGSGSDDAGPNPLLTVELRLQDYHPAPVSYILRGDRRQRTSWVTEDILSEADIRLVCRTDDGVRLLCGRSDLNDFVQRTQLVGDPALLPAALRLIEDEAALARGTEFWPAIRSYEDLTQQLGRVDWTLWSALTGPHHDAH
jgi:hypothetical protein